MMQQNALLESYLRQLKLPSFAQNYAAFAQDAARTDLSCERYLLALCEAELAQRELKLSRFLALLGKQELLVLDEFGFIPFSREGANLLFQLCSALYERSAIIITSNLKFGDWKNVLGEEHLTAALLDRLTHRAHILEFLGESFRFRQRLQQAERAGHQVEVADPAMASAVPASSSG